MSIKCTKFMLCPVDTTNGQSGGKYKLWQKWLLNQCFRQGNKSVSLNVASQNAFNLFLNTMHAIMVAV